MKRILVFCVLVLAALACGQNVTPQKADPQQVAAPPKAFKIGESIDAGAVTLTVNGVTSPPGDEFTKPDAGNKFLLVDLSFTNKSQQSAHISSILQMSLKDGTGQAYKSDLKAMTMSPGASPEGELAPGETIRGQLGFQVPANATGMQFVYDASLFGSGKVFVELP